MDLRNSLDAIAIKSQYFVSAIRVDTQDVTNSDKRFVTKAYDQAASFCIH
jgi:hypothetical protein